MNYGLRIMNEMLGGGGLILRFYFEKNRQKFF